MMGSKAMSDSNSTRAWTTNSDFSFVDLFLKNSGLQVQSGNMEMMSFGSEEENGWVLKSAESETAVHGDGDC